MCVVTSCGSWLHAGLVLTASDFDRARRPVTAAAVLFLAVLTVRLRPFSDVQGALQSKLKTLLLERKNEQRAAELAAVVQQAELQRAQRQVKQLGQELRDEQASAERAGRRAALEAHNLRKVSPTPAQDQNHWI